MRIRIVTPARPIHEIAFAGAHSRTVEMNNTNVKKKNKKRLLKNIKKKKQNAKDIRWSNQEIRTRRQLTSKSDDLVVRQTNT